MREKRQFPSSQWIIRVAFAALIIVAVGAGAWAESASLSGRPRVVSSRTADSYALVRGDHWISLNFSVEYVERLRGRWPGDFLWFRRGGKTYVIRDSVVLAEAFALFEPVRVLDPEVAALERRQAELEKKERALDREQEELERVGDRLSDEGERRQEDERRRLEVRERDLESRMHRLEEEMRKLEVIENSLDQRQDALEQEAERRLWKLIDGALSQGIAQPAKKL